MKDSVLAVRKLTAGPLVNLGKWILRNLFTMLLDEELRRDEVYRRNLRPKFGGLNGLRRGNAPVSISVPVAEMHSSTVPRGGDSMVAPRLVSRSNVAPATPSLSIGIATPALPSQPAHQGTTHLPPTAEEGFALEKRASYQSQLPNTQDKSSDYFSSNPNSQKSESSSENNMKAPETPGEGPPSTNPTSPTDDKEEKKKSSLFGKKFQMTFPKKLGRNSVEAKPVPAIEDKAEDMSDRSSEREEKVFEDNFLGALQRIRHDYDEHVQADHEQPLSVGITPSLPNETPLLRLPPHTLIIIQEDNPESGGLADLYKGAVSSLGDEADVVEKIAPMWLGDLLLRVCR